MRNNLERGETRGVQPNDTEYPGTLATFVWTLFDNSGQIPKVVALERDKRVRIIKKGVYAALVNRYGRI
jgi:hypothetical protein